MKESIVIIKTTTNDKETAAKIATRLLESKKAACVGIQMIESNYIWNSSVVSDKEFLLEIKTRKSLSSEIFSIIKSLHNYSLPEIIQISIDDTTTEYLNWIIKETGQPSIN